MALWATLNHIVCCSFVLFFPLMVPAWLCWKKSTCPFTVLKTQDGILTVWQGTVSGLWLGAVAAVCLICRLRCSTQSCRSCWFVHTTWIRSNIGPAGNGKRQRRSQRAIATSAILNIFGSSYRWARTRFCERHCRPVWSPSCWPGAVSPAEGDHREAEC